MTSSTPRRSLPRAALGLRPLAAVAVLGRGFRNLLRQVGATLSLTVAVVGYGFEPDTWRRTVREEFLWNAYQIAVGGIPAVAGTGALIGLVMVSQAFVWIGITGEVDVIANVLILTLIREAAPVFTALIVVGRSATVISVVLGRMTVTGQIRSMEALGIDAVKYLVVPRVLAASVGCFALTIVFVCAALAMGYLVGKVAGLSDISPGQFLVVVLDSMGPTEFILPPTKSLLAGYAAGIVACSIGLSSRIARGGARQILPRCFVLGSLTVLTISIALTLIVYG